MIWRDPTGKLPSRECWRCSTARLVGLTIIPLTLSAWTVCQPTSSSNLLEARVPFIRTPWKGPVADLQKLRVDISVITERLESSIKLVGEAYFSELYDLLVKKLALKSWHDSIMRKLDILSDIRSVYQHKMDAIREDLLSTLIIILIFIELMVGIFK